MKIFHHANPEFRCVYVLFFLSCLIPGICFARQLQEHPQLAPQYKWDFEDSLEKRSVKARLYSSDSRMDGSLRINSEQCNTTTFLMRLPALAGQKIDLKEIQTLPDGNFIGVGNIRFNSIDKEGLLFKMNNAGAILLQNRFRLNNYNTSIYDCKALSSGKIIIAGTINDGNNSVFISVLNNDLSTDWLRVFSMPASTSNMTLSIFDKTQIAWATQLVDSSISYSVLSGAGNIVWDKKVSSLGLTNLVDFGMLVWNRLGLVTNCIRNSKQVVEVMEFDISTGFLFTSHTIGDATSENKFLEATSFSARQVTLGVVKHTGGQFKIVRNNMFTSGSIETEHVYTLPGTINFNISGSLDNAGDAMGICLPQDGKLIFIKHFNYYQTSPEYIRQYTVPTGSSIHSVTRSVDGGFLFGLGASDSSSITFIKTDSIGLLPGCGYTDIPISYTETMVKQNTASISNDITNIRGAVNSSVSLSTSTLAGQFDCNVTYCPPAPPIDTCLNTYFKTMRSNSYVDAFSYYFLMRNNNHLAVTRQYDRYLNEMHQLTYGLKLFDEAGKFIRGVDVYVDSVSSYSMARQMDDQSIMLLTRTVKNGSLFFSFTLVSDDLQILWSKTIKTYNDFGYNIGGIGMGDLIRDVEGNYYMVVTHSGFMSITRKILVYKMDNLGNQVWLKAYSIQNGTFGPSRAISTATSIVVMIEAGNGGVTVRLDKNSGEMLNAFEHKITWRGSIYDQVVKYDNQKIYYAGNHTDSKFTMATFDTIGRPIRIRVIDLPSSSIRGATYKSGNLYGMFNYFGGSGYRDVLFKTDTDLNILFANDFNPIRYGFTVGIDIGDNGSIYVGGNNSYGGYYDPYIVKYNSSGELGTCSYVPISIPLTDLSTAYSSLTFSPYPVTISPDNLPVHFLPTTMGQRVSAIICSSTQLCDTIYLVGPKRVCQLNENFTYNANTNPGCTLQPSWIYDTSYIRMQSLNGASVTIQFKRTGSTWIKVKLSTGCVVYEDSMLVQIQTSPSSIWLGRDSTFCPGDTVLLNAGGGFNSYLWQYGSTDSTYYAILPGQYFVQATNACGNLYYDSIVLSQAIIPMLSIGNDSIICRKDTLIISANPGFSNYTWTPNSVIIGQGQQIAVAPSQATTISLDALTVDGCHILDSITIAIKEARAVFIGNDTSFCSGQSTTLMSANAYSQYLWSSGSVATSITVNQAGTYSLTVVDSNNCKNADTMLVSAVHPLPIVNLGADFDMCAGEQRRLDAGNFSSYTWSDGSSGRYMTMSNIGTYWVNVIDNNGCAGTDTLSIEKIKPIPIDFLIAVDSICQYDKLELQSNRTFQSYRWSTGSTQAWASIEDPGTYILTVMDVNGCKGTDTVQVFQKQCYSGIDFPNGFTPNGDQLNDVFKAKVYGSVIKYNLQVYNRNGELVFMTSDPANGWNGIFKGLLQPSAVFVWQCSYQLQGGDPKFEKGIVTLIR